MKDLAEAEPKRSIRISRTDTNRSSGIIHQNAKHREDLIYIETDESNRRDGHRVWGGLADNECEENDQRGPECQA